MSRVLGLGALLAAAAGPSHALGVPRHTVWVYSDEVSSALARETLIERSAASGVDDLYVSVYQPTPNAAGRRMYEEGDIADLVARAGAEGIAVWAAYGAPDWPSLGCSASGFPLGRMHEVLDYNAAHPTARFEGVMLDVEPPDPQTPDELADLLALYTCIRDQLASGGAETAAAIRHFWNTEVAWAGRTLPAHQHVIDLGLDHVVVLAYRDTAGTACAGAEPDGSICLAEDEIGYASADTAQAAEGMVLVGLETSDCAPGCGPAKVTFFEEGQDALAEEGWLVSAHYAGSPGFGGLSVHRYGAAYLGGGAGWPEQNLAWQDPPVVPALGSAARLALLGCLVLAGWRRTAPARVRG